MSAAASDELIKKKGIYYNLYRAQYRYLMTI